MVARATGGRRAADAGGDLDGARLIALNMALNGESRADTERYLAENFQLPDRQKLIDEVYAAMRARTRQQPRRTCAERNDGGPQANVCSPN